MHAPASPFFRFQGDEGEVVIEASFEGGASLYREGVDEATGAGTGQPVHEELCRQGWAPSYEGEMRDFCGAVLEGAALETTPASALADLRVIEAVLDVTRAPPRSRRCSAGAAKC